jgi:hypothetical protein
MINREEAGSHKGDDFAMAACVLGNHVSVEYDHAWETRCVKGGTPLKGKGTACKIYLWIPTSRVPGMACKIGLLGCV